MATVTPTQTYPENATQQDLVMFTWATLTNTNNTGVAIEFGHFADRSAIARGTFGSGDAVIIEGSHDGTNFYTLTDAFGNALSMTSAGIKQITELVAYLRPRVSGSSGGSNITVTLLTRRHP